MDASSHKTVPHPTSRWGSMGLTTAKLEPSKLKLVSFVSSTAALPSKVDLRSKLPQVYDQGRLESCIAHASCAAVQFLVPSFMGSRLFLWYQARLMEGYASANAGGYLHDCMQVLETLGIPPESEWPYDATQFAVAPPNSTYPSALRHRVLQAVNVPEDIQQMKGCLAAGFPFVIGIKLRTGLMQNVACNGGMVNGTFVKGTGMVDLPPTSAASIGGHAVCVVGYDDSMQRWIVRNSWGVNAGDNGHFYFPYDYISTQYLASDLWSVRLMSSDTNVPVQAGVDCAVGEWEVTTPCSAAACGQRGSQAMSRSVVTKPTSSGRACPALQSNQACKAPACANLAGRGCVVGPWSAPTACTATVCGTAGTRTFSRIVKTPASRGGSACLSLLQKQYCAAPSCTNDATHQ